MSNDVLRSFSENASRLGMRLQESFSEHTRSLQKETFYDATDDKTRNIRKQLDSNSEREKLVAIKLLIALTSKGRNMAEYFAPVVKNVASANLELRKLVYIFLLRYAEQEPDLALLSINTFQKDLADPNPIIRAMALRVLSGIKIPMIANIVLLAIKKCAADISPYVRKVAALAVPKCYELDPGLQESLVEIIATMWKDRSPLSIGSVVVAFEAVCPTRLDLLHKYYRRLCKALVDVDEWGQVDLMNLLLRYARTMLPRPKDDEETDKDVRLLLTSAEPVFFSRNPAVVIAAARIVFYAGPPSCHSQIVEPLIRLTHSSPEVERIVLSYILASNPSLFASHYTHFLISCTDLPDTKAAKLRLLLAMLNYDNHAGILRELVEQEAVHEIGRCAVRVPECSEQCVAALLGMVDRGNDEAVVVLKDLVPATVVDRLAKRLDVVRDAKARATVVWLVGQYAEGSSTVDGLASYAPDVLRLVAKSFKDEQRTVKLQVITMAAKLAVLSTDTRVGLLTRYVLQLARYDVDWDVRDRTRMLLGLLAGLEPSTEGEREGVVLRREQVKLVLFEGKKTVIDVDEPVNAMIGTWSAITGKRSIEEPILPDWLERGVSSVLRDSEEDAAPPPPPVVTSISSADVRRSRVVASAPQKAEASTPWKSLDAFYEENGEGGTDEDEDEDGSGSGEEGNTSESDGEEEDDESESESGSQPGNSEEEEAEEDESEDDVHRYPSRSLAS